MRGRSIAGACLVLSGGSTLEDPEALWKAKGPSSDQYEQLFEDIRKRLDEGCRNTSRYDESLGDPLSTYSDCGMEGGGWTVTDFASSP